MSKRIRKSEGSIRQREGRWQVRWTDADGKRHAVTRDTKDDAGLELKRRLVEVEERRRGLARLAPSARTFNELAAEWLRVRAPQKRGGKTDASFIRAHLMPFFGEYKLTEITKSVIERYKTTATRVRPDSEGQKKMAPKTLHAHLTLLRSMLGHAVDDGWLDTLPKIKKPSIVVLDSNFRYLRTDDEIRRFLVAARAEDSDGLVHTFYAMALLSGLRAGECAALQWDDVSFERRLITVTRSFDGPTKSGSTRHVPLSDDLASVLRAWRLRTPGRLVAPNRAGRMHLPAARIFQETLARVLVRAGFPPLPKPGESRAVGYITFHGLRHTFASLWMARGGDLFKLQRVLGHSSSEMTQRYAHLAPSAFQGDHARLSGLIAAAADNVVPIGERHKA